MALTFFIVSVKKHDWMTYENLFTQTNQDFTIYFRLENSKMFNITSNVFNNNPPASWVMYTCYSSSYYSYMVNDTHKEYCFTQFSTRIYWNRSVVASDIFPMFTQSLDFYYILLWRIKDYRCLNNVIHQIDINECLVLSAFQQVLWQYLS